MYVYSVSVLRISFHSALCILRSTRIQPMAVEGNPLGGLEFVRVQPGASSTKPWRTSAHTSLHAEWA